MRTWPGLLVVFSLLISSLAQPARAEGPASTPDLPKKAYVQGMTGHPQRYILSCEARSAVDWAAFWGVKIGETEFLKKLPQSSDPDAGFVGNANDRWGLVPPSSYGVHAKPVSDLLNAYGFQTQASKGLKWEDLRLEIAAGRPVIVWIIGQMWSGTPVKYRPSRGSRPTTVANFEHTMILVGYTPQRVQVVDAYTGFEQTYPLSQFLASWSVLGNMAVTGFRPAPPVETLSPEQTYQVQPGDNLIKVAEQMGISLEQLAELNQIQNPHMLVVGSVLRLPPVVGPAPALSPQAASHHVYLPLSLGSQPHPTPAPVTYVVREGDFLIEIARLYGVSWRDLAELNWLEPPYQLFPGQVLLIR